MRQFWREVRARVHPQGEVVVHAPLPRDPDYPRSLGLPGQVIVRKWRASEGDVFCTTAWYPTGSRSIRIREVPAATP